VGHTHVTGADDHWSEDKDVVEELEEEPSMDAGLEVGKRATKPNQRCVRPEWAK
jgi:hypothetical protein